MRFSIYKNCEIVHIPESGTLVEPDVETTKFVYVVLSGRVDYMMYKFDTKTTIVAATYRAGEVFGDASIQKQFFDVLKILSQDRKYFQTSCEDVYAVKVPKQAFIEAIFAEMRLELMFKILMFRQTSYFSELSPYSLIMFANICEVREYNYGEIILSQGEKPTECYLLAHGRCQSVIQYTQEEQTTSINKHTRNILTREVTVPMKMGPIDYVKLPL